MKSRQSSYANLNGYETAKMQLLMKDKATVDALVSLISKDGPVDLNFLQMIEEKYSVTNITRIVDLL